MNLQRPANLVASLNQNRYVWYKILRNGPYWGGLKLRELISRNGRLQLNLAAAKTYDGVLKGSIFPVWKPSGLGPSQGALYHAGLSSYVDMSFTTLTPIAPLSYFCWFFLTQDTTGPYSLVSVQSAAGLQFRVNSGTMGITLSGQAASANTTLNAGQWYYGGVSLDATGAYQFYLNGKPDGNGTTGQFPSRTGLQLGIFQNSEYLIGLMDSATVYLVVVGDAFAADLYEEELNGCPTTLNWLPSKAGFTGSPPPIILSCSPAMLAAR